MTGGTETGVARWLRIGFLADGCFKLLVAIGYVATLPLLTDVLAVGGWLIMITGALVAVSGVAEIIFAVRSGSGSHTRFLIAYDSGWMIISIVAIILAINGVSTAGAIWLGYQVLAAPIIAAVFALGALPNRQSAAGTGSER